MKHIGRVAVSGTMVLAVVAGVGGCGQTTPQSAMLTLPQPTAPSQTSIPSGFPTDPSDFPSNAKGPLPPEPPPPTANDTKPKRAPLTKDQIDEIYLYYGQPLDQARKNARKAGVELRVVPNAGQVAGRLRPNRITVSVNSDGIVDGVRNG